MSTEPDGPTEAARCGHTIIDEDGYEQPCDLPAGEWRWYQNVEHEDMLAPACVIHANEGGRRMHAAEERAEEEEAAAKHAEAQQRAAEIRAENWWERYKAMVARVEARLDEESPCLDRHLGATTCDHPGCVLERDIRATLADPERDEEGGRG